MALRPTFMGFETASRGIMINQKAMDIVGNNIANLGVTGYTRQRVDQISMAIDYRNTRYVVRNSMNGQGATIGGISQMRDSFLDKRFREEYGDVGYYQTISQALEDVDAALQEVEPEQMSIAISKFRDALGTMFTNDGGDSVAASSVRASAQTVTQVLQQLSAKLDNVWDQQYYDLEINVNEVNKKLASIAAYNDAIKKEQSAIDYSNSGYYGPNELMDQRNVLLDDLSSYGNILVKQNMDGTVDVTMNGHSVVKGNEYEQVNLSPGPTDQTVKLCWNSTGDAMHLQTGGLKAAVDLLNGRGLTARQDYGESAYNGILYYKSKINALAESFVREMNNAIPMDGENPDPAFKQLFTFGYETDANGNIKMENGKPVEREHTAANIQITEEWADKATYLMDGIKQNGTGDANYLEKIIQTLFSNDAEVDFGDFKGSFTQYVTYYTTTLLGTQISGASDRLASSASVSNNLLDRIASVSGVNMNEEAADSMQYQKAYDAMSRVLTALDDLLDKLINGTGRVGL